VSAKAKVIVIKKFLVGEWDLLAYAYGTVGRCKIFVRRGFHPEESYCGFFEPFNLLTIDYHQSGDLLILNDLVSAKLYSYLALKSYDRFLWMSKVLQTILRWVAYYDSSIFKLLQNFLLLDVKNHKVFDIKLKLSLIKAMGIYRNVEDVSLASMIEKIDQETSLDRLERLRLSEQIYKSINEILEDMLKGTLD
jgi:recombinational DNA repair protein (RecF pathway)